MNENAGDQKNRITPSEMKSKVTHGLLWKLAELTGSQGIQFVVAIILARLILPSEYGTIGLITIFITIANVFVQSGFATALIQKREVEESDYSSVSRICMLLALVVYAVLYFMAPLVAAYYETPVLKPLLRVMGIMLFPGAVISIQTAVIARSMDFKKLFRSTMCAVVISGIVSIAMAVLQYGVWAMAAQQLLYYFALMGALFVTVRWRPGKAFSAERLKELFHFGWKILVSGLIDTIWMNVYGLIIGKRYSQADLGGFNRGEQFPKLITNNLSSAIQSVLLPAYSQTQDDRTRLKQMMKRSIRLSAFITFPMMAGLIAASGPLVSVLLTDKWLFCVPYLCIMCIAYAFWPIHVINLQMMNALGRSDLILKLEIIKKVIGIIILLISLRYGIIFMLVLKAIDEFLCSFINAYPNKKLIDYGIAEQYSDMLPSALCATAMGFAVYAIRKALLPVPAVLLLQIITGVLFYTAMSAMFNRESFGYLKETLANLKNGRSGVRNPE